MDMWKFYGITHREHVVCNPTSEEKLTRLVELLRLPTGAQAKSTHAGLPWLRYLRKRLGEGVHFWPFDGWEIPAGRSALVEVYPSLWSKSFPRRAARPISMMPTSLLSGCSRSI